MNDLQLFYINLVNGLEKADLPGVLALSAPRKAARGRQNEIVLIFLNLAGSGAISYTDPSRLLQQTADRYFATPGAVTSGIRQAVEYLNGHLLSQNLRGSRDGLQMIGNLNMLVIHDETLYFAQAGSGQTFLLSEGDAKNLQETTGEERGLGLSRTPNLRLSMADTKNGSLFVLCPNPPASWTPAHLHGSGKLTLEQLRRRLLNQAGPDVQIVILKVAPGKGMVSQRRLASNTSPLVPPSTAPAAVSAVAAVVEKPTGPRPEPQVIAQAEALPVAQPKAEPVVAPIEAPQPAPEQPQSTPPAQPVKESIPVRSLMKKFEEAPAAETPDQPVAPPRRKARPVVVKGSISTFNLKATLRRLRDRMVPVWQKMRESNRQSSQKMSRFLGRMMPGNADRSMKASPAAMLFVAIAVPVLIISVALTVYLRNGQNEQHNLNLQQAQSLILQAQSTTDRNTQRALWAQALDWIDKAEDYVVTDVSRELRQEAQSALDTIDGVVRLDFTNALASSLPQGIMISRIIPYGDDLYLLDSVSGNVYRLVRNREYSYELDLDFKCGPVAAGITVGPLIDIVDLPANSPNDAPILGIDAGGNLEYCSPGYDILARALPVPADFGWRSITAIARDQGILYVLDSGTNRVWQYYADVSTADNAVDDMVFTTSPGTFFDNIVPQNLTDVLDMVVKQNDLFLLHRTGQMTWCVYGAITDLKNTECADPAIYNDMRSGVTAEPLDLTGLNFIHSQIMSVADPSLFILDGTGPAIYQFGLQLNLYHVLNVKLNEDYTLPSAPVSSFAVTQDRMVYLAFGNELYYARLK